MKYLLILLVPVFVFAQTCTDSLGGWTQAGVAPTYTYLSVPKWHMITPVDSCIVDCFGLYIYDYTGDRTDDSIRCFIWSDSLVGADHYPGHGIAMASEWHYDWTTLGDSTVHYFTVDSIFPNQSDTLSSGKNYWLGIWYDSTGTVEIERGRLEFQDCPTSKVGDTGTWPVEYVPVFADWAIHYGTGQSCMGQSIWGTLLSTGSTGTRLDGGGIGTFKGGGEGILE